MEVLRLPKMPMMEVTFQARGSYQSYATPGTTYTEMSAQWRKKVDFSKINAVAFRVVVAYGDADEAGSGKGIEIYDNTGSQQLAEVTWDGSSAQYALAGSWTTTNIPTADSILTAKIKASSATESIDVHGVYLQILYV